MIGLCLQFFTTMVQKDSYITIGAPGYAESQARGSKFIAYAYPLKSKEDFKEQLALVKKLQPKASHYCFAYRLGTDGNEFRVSDAGEPSGTAGRPVLNQIDSKGLTDINIVVVRYFGGTLLGIPGLIDAYKTAASFVLQCTPVLKKLVETTYRIECDYLNMNEVLNLLKQNNCSVIEIENSLFARIVSGIPVSQEQYLVDQLHRFRHLKATRVDPNR